MIRQTILETRIRLTLGGTDMKPNINPGPNQCRNQIKFLNAPATTNSLIPLRPTPLSVFIKLGIKDASWWLRYIHIPYI